MYDKLTWNNIFYCHFYQLIVKLYFEGWKRKKSKCIYYKVSKEALRLVSLSPLDFLFHSISSNTFFLILRIKEYVKIPSKFLYKNDLHVIQLHWNILIISRRFLLCWNALILIMDSSKLRTGQVHITNEEVNRLIYLF